MGRFGQHVYGNCVQTLGRKMTEQLVIAHHFLLNRTTKFEDAANALITADKNLNQGREESVIQDIFVRRGIIPNPSRKNMRAGVHLTMLVLVVLGYDDNENSSTWEI